MPVKLDEPRHYEWNVPRSNQKERQVRHQIEPFLLLDASTAPSEYGETALFLCLPCDADGNKTGDEFVLALGLEGREKRVTEAQAVADKHHHTDGIGPLIIQMIDTDKGNPFPAFRTYHPEVGETKGRKASTRKATTPEIDPDDIPF